MRTYRVNKVRFSSSRKTKQISGTSLLRTAKQGIQVQQGCLHVNIFRSPQDTPANQKRRQIQKYDQSQLPVKNTAPLHQKRLAYSLQKDFQRYTYKCCTCRKGRFVTMSCRHWYRSFHLKPFCICSVQGQLLFLLPPAGDREMAVFRDCS